MNIKSLLFIDAFFSVFLISISLIFRLRSKFLKILQIKASPNKVLVIKFLGAGNFIAMAETLNISKCHIVSVINNQSALKEFIPDANLILINDNKYYNLFSSSLLIFFNLFYNSFDKVINLEAESSFAKFISSIPFSNEVNGLSNKYKSILDWYFYDYHIVSPSNLGRERILKILLRLEQPKVNVANALTLKLLNLVNEYNDFVPIKDFVFISPTCSMTDTNRRLDIEVWGWILQKLSKEFKSVIVGFSSDKDLQYLEFQTLLLHNSYHNILIVVESYIDFLERIKSCNLLVTIDSQALHIGQQLGKKVLCFYGPTTPHGIKLSNYTYAVSKELECSPCTHKYFLEPCRGSIDCMRLTKDQTITIFKKILG